MDLQEAKSIITIPRLWDYYALPGEPNRSCKSPFREDRNPSFSVTDDGMRWKDFGTGEGGDAITLIEKCEGIDNKAACLRIIELAGGKPEEQFKGKVRRETRPKSKPDETAGITRGSIERLRLGSEIELEQLRELRGFPPYAADGLLLLQVRGMLRFYEKGGLTYWVVCDSTGKNIQERRLDGAPIPVKDRDPIKSKTWPGSKASWPIGMELAREFERILVVEGGPDLLAAAAVACRFLGDEIDYVGFVAITGAGNRLPEDELRFWSKKTVTLFEHADDAGATACNRWREQLKEVGCANVRTLRLFDYSQAKDSFLEDMEGNPIGDLADVVHAGEWMPDTFWQRLGRLINR